MSKASAPGEPAQHLRFELLDGLRGIAALAVAVLHFSQTFGLPYEPVNARLAVDFFFCLSGFVVAYSYRERLRSGVMSPMDYVKKRVIRLYPLVALGCALGIVATLGLLVTHKIDAGSFAILAAASFLLLPAGLWYGMQAYPFNNPLWSLFFELVASLGYGVVARLSNRVVTVLWAASGIALFASIVLNHGLGGFGFDADHFAYGFLRVAYPFLSGALFYSSGLYRVRIVSIGRIPAIAILCALLFVPWLPAGAAAAWYLAVLVTIVVPVIVVLAVNVRSAGPEPRAILFIGLLSYPFYVVNQPVMRIVFLVAKRVGSSDVVVAGAILASLLGSAVVAYIALEYYDKPVRERLTRWAFSRRKALKLA